MMTTIDRILKHCAVAAVLTLAGAQAVEAQVFTPTFMSPVPSSDIGVYLSDGPGEFALEGIWRRATGGYDLGLRAGVADTEDLSLLVGGEIRNALSVGAPLDLAVTGAAQGIFGDDAGGGVLVGLTIGSTFGDSSLAFTPYIHPQVGIIKLPYGEADLDLAADFGVDVRISPRLDLRFAFALERPGGEWGVGFAWR